MSQGKLQEKIVEVFSDAQVGLQHHQKLLKSLKAVCKDGTSEDEFLSVFVELLKHAFVVFKREPAVDRLISFAGYFFASSGEDFVQKFLQRTLSPFHAARDKAVRFRVTQLTFKILDRLSANEEVELNEEVYRIIYKATMVLAFDKVYQIRTQAILCLGRIQDNSDPTCPVVAAMLDRLQRDSSHEVRRCALQNLAPSLISLPYIVERTRDVKDTIRKTAYSVLAKKFTILNLTISQRIQLLKDGLNDNSAMVKDACISLLFSWLSLFDGDVIALLTKLDVEGSGEVTEMALTHIFKMISAEDLVSAMQGMMQSNDDVDHQDDIIDHQDSGVDHQDNNVDHQGDDVDQDNDTTKRGLINSCVIPHNKLTSEAAFFWTCLCTYYHSLGDKGEQHLSKILPTAMEFADYLKRFLHDYLFPAAKDEEKIYEHLFVAKQLISLTKLLDLSDEFGRQKLMEFYCETLSLADCTHELTAAILEHIFCLWPQETSCIEKLVGAISEIRQPMESIDPTAAHERELHIAGIKVTLNEYRDQLEKAVTEQNFVMAANYKGKIMEQETLLNAELDHTINSTNTTIGAANISIIDPPEVLHKCLLIAHKLYSNLKMQKLGPVLMTLLETLVLPCVQNEEPVVRNMAFFCLGSASLLDVSQAQKYFHLLLQVSQIDHEMIQATALKMVFDILLLYGTEMFQSGAKDDKDDEKYEDEEDDGGVMADLNFSDEAIDKRQDGDEATHKLLKILVDFLDHESIALREIAGEGLIKLLYSGRVLSQRILARLLLLWFNPVMEDDSILRNLLGTFFPIFASIERCNSECLCEVFVPVLSTVVEAPDTSPLAAIDVNNMADFLLSITTSKTPSDNGHNTLAIAVCHKLLSCCSDGTTGVEVYCRALSKMCLTKDHQSDLVSLHVLLNQLKTVVRGQQNLRNIDKLSTALSKLCPASAVNSQSPTHITDSHTPAVASTVSKRVAHTANAIDKENVEPITSVRPTVKRTVKKVVLQNTDTTQKLSSTRDMLLDQCSGSGSDCSDVDVTVPRQRRSPTTVTKLDYKSCSDDNDSDDSYLETDSPFVVHTKSRTRSKRQVIVSSEDDT